MITNVFQDSVLFHRSKDSYDSKKSWLNIVLDLTLVFWGRATRFDRCAIGRIIFEGLVFTEGTIFEMENGFFSTNAGE